MNTTVYSLTEEIYLIVINGICWIYIVYKTLYLYIFCSVVLKMLLS